GSLVELVGKSAFAPYIHIVHGAAIMSDHLEQVIQAGPDRTFLKCGVEDQHQLVMTQGELHLLRTRRSRSFRDRRALHQVPRGSGSRSIHPQATGAFYPVRVAAHQSGPATSQAEFAEPEMACRPGSTAVLEEQPLVIVITPVGDARLSRPHQAVLDELPLLDAEGEVPLPCC